MRFLSRSNVRKRKFSSLELKWYNFFTYFQQIYQRNLHDKYMYDHHNNDDDYYVYWRDDMFAVWFNLQNYFRVIQYDKQLLYTILNYQSPNLRINCEIKSYYAKRDASPVRVHYNRAECISFVDPTISLYSRI